MTVKQQYWKVRSKIQSRIRYYRKKGFDVDIQLPKIPKKITAGSIRRLEKITSAKVKEKAYTANPETGEVITYQQFQNYKKRTGQKDLTPFQLPAELPIPAPSTPQPQTSPENVSRETFDGQEFTWDAFIFDRYLEVVDRIHCYTKPSLDETLHKMAIDWLERNISKNGSYTTAKALDEAANNGYFSAIENAYTEEDLLKILQDIMSFMDVSAAEKNDVMSAFYEDGQIYEEYE